MAELVRSARRDLGERGRLAKHVSRTGTAQYMSNVWSCRVLGLDMMKLGTGFRGEVRIV